MSFEQPDEPMTDVGLYDIDLEEATGPKAVIVQEEIVGMEADTVEAGAAEAGIAEARAVPPSTGVSKPFIAAQKLDPTHAILMFFGSILFPPIGCVAFCRYSTDPDVRRMTGEGGACTHLVARVVLSLLRTHPARYGQASVAVGPTESEELLCFPLSLCFRGKRALILGSALAFIYVLVIAGVSRADKLRCRPVIMGWLSVWCFVPSGGRLGLVRR